MAMTVDQASAAMREAMRATVKRYSLWYLLEAVLMVVAGVFALVYPYLASVTLVFLLGWILIISGVLQGIGLIGARDAPHFWLHFISAVLAILIGALLLRNPDAGLLIMTVLLIVFFFVEGISKIIFALNIRPFIGWGWVLLSGIIGLLLGPICGRTCRSARNGCWASCSAFSSSSRAWPWAFSPGPPARAERA